MKTIKFEDKLVMYHNKINKHMKLFKTLFLVGLVMLATNCTEKEAVLPNQSVLHYTGEELFKGIVLMEGNLIDELPKTKKLLPNLGELLTNQTERKLLAEVRNFYVSRIKENNPLFFGNFKNNIQSGDHFLVKKALDDAGVALAEIIDTDSVLHKLSIEEEEEILRKINFDEFINNDGSVKKDALVDHVEKNIAISNLKVLEDNPVGNCVVWNIIVIVNVGVLFNAAIGFNAAIAVNVGVAGNLALAQNVGVQRNIAISVDRAVSGGDPSGGEIPLDDPTGRLAQEIMVDEIVNHLSI